MDEKNEVKNNGRDYFVTVFSLRRPTGTRPGWFMRD